MLVDLDDLERLQNTSMVTKGVAAAAIDSSCGFIGTGSGTAAGAGATGAAGRAGRAPPRRSQSYTHGSRWGSSSANCSNGVGMIGNGNGFSVTKAWAGVGGTLAEFDLSLDLDGPAPAPLPAIASVRKATLYVG